MWGVATRILTAGTNIVLAKGTGVTGFNDPTAAAISTQVASDLATAHGAGTWATATGFSTLTTSDIPTTAQISAALLAAGDVDGLSLEQTLKICLAALAGKLSGAATTTVVIRAADDSKARITATVDADGNRSAITLDSAG